MHCVVMADFQKPFTRRVLPIHFRFRNLQGWHMDMESADLLHVLWLGAARDSIGSVLMEIVTWDPRFQQSGSYDVALAQVLTLVHDFCDTHGIDKSTIDELSFSMQTFGIELWKCFRDSVFLWVSNM